ncbi:hypothetical protein [Actinacidiphila bryophytorum]|uniref:hypothetical protein n=1 Tax=Actinacidiphila bryophytorum TaxID=1436133 RepID=UPI0021769D7C|nr:hypothetical protein [Actinacidiphila bryophytorum]UWE13346.1 hypothetical protein NYE86_34850 [Actinacidiphila bryophytorum]
MFAYAAERPVPFPGHAVTGSNRASIQATCVSSESYISFAIYFSRDRVENTPTGYRKLLRFVNDFVPKETKKFNCTT